MFLLLLSYFLTYGLMTYSLFSSFLLFSLPFFLLEYYYYHFLTYFLVMNLLMVTFLAHHCYIICSLQVICSFLSTFRLPFYLLTFILTDIQLSLQQVTFSLFCHLLFYTYLFLHQLLNSYAYFIQQGCSRQRHPQYHFRQPSIHVLVFTFSH